MIEKIATHAALLTPAGRGAVAVIAVDGPAAVDATSACFSSWKRFSDRAANEIAFGRWGGESGEEVVATRRSPARVEVHCHGGRAAAERILADLAQRGCQIVDCNMWLALTTAGRIVAEADVALAETTTERAARILLDQREGALVRTIDEVRVAIAGGELVAAQERLCRLLERATIGLRLAEPWRVALAGEPNVGKSSLMNALLGYERAIVFDSPGTTRDVVTAATALCGWPIELADTAGLGDPADELECAGVERAQAQIARADLVLAVCDASRPWTPCDDRFVASLPNRLLVHNKADLHAGPRGDRPAGLWTCAIAGNGIEALVKTIASTLAPDAPAAGEAVPFTARQRDCLAAAEAATRSGDGENALDALEECRIGWHGWLVHSCGRH